MQAMQYMYSEGKDPTKPTLLLLHGTGGTEEDLLPIAKYVDPNANVLAVRGNVSENGMARFFRRVAEGVFDEEDLISRTEELNIFLDEKAEQYQFDRNNIVAIGYSNGANIAASLLFHFKNALCGAILHHPMVPRRGIDLPNLMDKKVLIIAGKNDPLCPAEESKDLFTLLEKAGAKVELHWENHGHQLTIGEIKTAMNWYKKHFN